MIFPLEIDSNAPEVSSNLLEIGSYFPEISIIFSRNEVTRVNYFPKKMDYKLQAKF
jgi:hypothetical protein